MGKNTINIYSFLLAPVINIVDSVTSSIVNEVGSIGVFHYNKLTYLFEFLFIKNFGRRYSQEKFIKLPHGPVICNYKKQIERLVKNKVINTDLSELKMKRTLDDDYFITIILKRGENTKDYIINESIVRDFLKRVINKYAFLNSKELEEVVYRTAPLKKYIQQVKNGFKKERGGYILDNNGIRMGDYLSNPKVKIRRTVLNHLEKFPDVDMEQQKKFSQELTYFEKFRPTWGNQ